MCYQRQYRVRTIQKGCRFCVNIAVMHVSYVAKRGQVASWIVARAKKLKKLADLFVFPLLEKPRQPVFARQKLLHDSLLDVVLLSNEAVQAAEEGGGVGEGGGDGKLFGEWRTNNRNAGAHLFI